MNETGEHAAGGGGDEHLVGFLEVAELEGAFLDLDPVDIDAVEQEQTGDAGQATGGQRRGGDGVAVDGEDIGRRALGDFIALIEENDFVEALVMRFLIHGEVVAPGKDLGAGKGAFGVARPGGRRRGEHWSPRR